MIRVSVLLCLFVSSIFAQEGAKAPPTPEEEREAYLRQFAKDPSAVKKAEDIPAAGSGSGSGAQEMDPDAEMEKLIAEMQVDAEKRKEMMGALKAQSGKGSGALSGNPQAFLPVGPDGKQDYAAIVRMILSPYKSLNQAQLESLLNERFGRHPVGGILLQVPKMKLFMVKMIQHPEALPSMAKIGMEKKKLATYGSFLIFTFILGSLLKRLMNRLSQDNVGSGLRRMLFRFGFMFTMRFGAFVLLFSQELKPTGEVIKNLFSAI